MTEPLHEFEQIEAIVRRALEEDIGSGDVTTLSTISKDLWLSGRVVARQAGIIAGLDAARLAFTLLDERVQFTPQVTDGQAVIPLQTIVFLEGPGRALLSGERSALNLLQRMSGIATFTHQFVQAVRHTRAVILDTRKTAPGLRYLDKRAVRLGGGENHRIGLFDMALIKNNHISAMGGDLRETFLRVHNWTRAEGRDVPIEVEVRTLAELEVALSLPVDRILLDNMPIDVLRAAVGLTAGRVPLEASGGISLENIRQIAETGIDYISIGALTHSAPALDISLWLDTKMPMVTEK